MAGSAASVAWLTRLVRAGAFSILGLAALHWSGYAWLDLNGEGNVPTWFSSLLLCGAALGAARSAQQRPAAEWLGWTVLAAGLLVMAGDELLQGHEAIGRAFNRLIFHDARWAGLRPWAQRFRATWTLAVAPLVLLWVGVVCVRLRGAWAGADHARQQVVAGAWCFVLGAFGLELSKYLLPAALPAWGGQLRYVLEESLEMSGSLLMLSGLWQRATTSTCNATSTH